MAVVGFCQLVEIWTGFKYSMVGRRFLLLFCGPVTDVAVIVDGVVGVVVLWVVGDLYTSYVLVPFFEADRVLRTRWVFASFLLLAHLKPLLEVHISSLSTNMVRIML